MGQLITVSEKPARRPDVAIFELNRSLTGMGHERFVGGQPVAGQRPVDELARRLLEHPDAEAVHVYSNMVTVDLRAGGTSAGMADTIRDLFTYYREGVEVVDPMAPGGAGAGDGDGTGEGGDEGDGGG